MELQRKYDADGKVIGVKVRHTGTREEQNFSSRLVDQGIIDGWILIEGDKLTMKAEPEDLVYQINREPGYYCASTRERIPITQRAWSSPHRGTLAQAEAHSWLRSRGLPSTDYEVTNAYECVLGSEQHAKFSITKGA